MEKSIVDFIIQNIFIFLPLVIIGMIVTLYLFFTGTKDKGEREYDVGDDKITLGSFTIGAYLLIYIFLFFMLILIGFLSDNFIIQTIICAFLAAIPIIIILILKFLRKQLKVL